jgi:type IV pilus assembly protein PilV
MLRRTQAGFTMIEVLITFVVLVVGLLGLIGLQARTQQAELESYQRGQALVLLQDIIDRMNANRIEAKNGVYSTGATPLGGGGALSDCSGLTGAVLDKCEWGNALIGAAEVSPGGTCTTTAGTNCIGAMLGARGCIAYDSSTELSNSSGVPVAGTGIHTITIAWQGVAHGVTALATNTCGQGAYPNEDMRRLVTATLRIGALNAQ